MKGKPPSLVTTSPTAEETAVKNQVQDEQGPVCYLMAMNADVLLEILSYCDPADICHVSRTCTWAKQFVDSNFHHLPRQEVTISIHMTDEVCKYDVQNNYHSTLLGLESKAFDTATVFPLLTYSECRCVWIHYETESVELVRSVMQQASRIEDTKEIGFEWRFGPWVCQYEEPSISWSSPDCTHCFDLLTPSSFLTFPEVEQLAMGLKLDQTEDLSLIQKLIYLPLETLLLEEDSQDFDVKIRELLLAAIQFPGLLRIYLEKHCREFEVWYECYFNALKVLYDKPELISDCTVEIRTPEPHFMDSDNEVQHRIPRALSKVWQKYNLCSFFEWAPTEVLGSFTVKPKFGSYVVHLTPESIQLCIVSIDTNQS